MKRMGSTTHAGAAVLYRPDSQTAKVAATSRTRNHRCGRVEELTNLTTAWLDEHGAFAIEGGVCTNAPGRRYEALSVHGGAVWKKGRRTSRHRRALGRAN